MELDFFRSNSAPYYVYAPDYRQTSAGIRALHQLCHVLNEFGLEAYLAHANITNPKLRSPRLTGDAVRQHFLAGRTPIAVYPEVVSGNPLNAPLIARWMLNRPGHLGGDKTYSEQELLFYFDTWVVPDGLLAEARPLTVPTIDPKVFNNENNPYDKHRHGACYYANKYLAFGGQVDFHPKDSVSLCHDIPRAPEEIAAILRKSAVLYCYEQSSIIPEALSCGCPVLVVPTNYWDCDRDPTFASHAGIRVATACNSLEEAWQTVHQFADLSKELLSQCIASVEGFICITQAAKDYFMARSSTKPSDEQAKDGRSLWAVPANLRDKFLPLFTRNVEHARDQPTEVCNSDTRAGKAQVAALPFGALRPLELNLFEKRLSHWENHVSFHLIVIEDSIRDTALTLTLQSLLRQHYTKVIATVIACRPATFELGEGRLEWWHTPDNPWLLVNEAIAKSPANWCGILRAGDALSSESFLVFAEFIHSHPQCRVFYSDEDVISGDGIRSSPRRKPDFDIEQLRCNGYVGGLLMAQRELWRSIGGWHALPRGIDELDAALRLDEVCGKGEFGHISEIHFHRDSSDPSLVGDTPERQEFRRLLVQEHLARLSIPAVVENGLLSGHVRVRYSLEIPPLVSILIPTRDNAASLESSLNSLVELNEYPNFEILVIDNGSQDGLARAYLDGIARLANEQIRVLTNSEPFNLAALFNFGATQARGELLLLLHDDITALHTDWLFNMAAFCMQTGVGAVGARLVQKDGTLQQGWLTPIKAGITAAPFHGWPLNAPDAQKPLNSDQEVTAVGSACMLVRKDAFLQVGGMDAEQFPTTFSDIDFCLKLRAAGHRILWTPYATLLHDSDNTLQGNKDDNNALLAKWGKAMVQDPFCNPYLAIGGDAYQMETEPSFLPDIITWHPLPNVYAMSSDFDGAGHYRIIQPTLGATDAALVRGRLGRGYPIPALIEKLDIDVIFSQRQVEDLQLSNLARYRKLLRCRIVIDIDDLITNVPDKNIHKKTLLKDMKGRMRQLAVVAHRFTVSTEPLAEDFRQYHDDVRVVPNSLMRHQWVDLTSQRRTSRKMRVGWAGGVSHQGDLEIIRDVVSELSGEVEWVFMGMCLKELAPHIKEFHDGAVFSAYPAKLASLNLDLAIAPLEINRFNECKSHLRLLEYGILGIPVIATDIHPYRGEFPVSRVKNKHKDWVRAIRDHINNVDETYRRGDLLKQYILDHWMLDQHLAEWVDAWGA